MGNPISPSDSARPARMRRMLPAALVFTVLCLLAARAIVSRHPVGPMEVSMWYWHSPFSLTSKETQDLSSLGVRQLFVRAGTISAANAGVASTMPQEWQLCPGAPAVHLVFVVDSGVARHFEDLSNRKIARCVAASFLRQRQAAQRAGLEVRGLQIDFDCATRLLPKYADLLKQLRRALPEGTILSITSLPTWFTSRDLRKLIKQVDFYCPQFYETWIGRVLSGVRPVTDLRVLRNGLEAARRLGRPFYAGIPAYGHAFMFDDRGRLLGTYRGMSAPEAARHPSFRLARSWPSDQSGKRAASTEQWVGEDLLDFVAVRAGAAGKGLGYHLVYSLPTTRMLAVNLAAVRERRPANCLGAIVFRSPEADEIMTLPMPSLSAALSARETRMIVKATVKTEQVPWSLVEGDQSAGASSAVTVSLENTGDECSLVAPDAVVLTLRFDAPGVEAEPGDFDRVDHLSDSGMRAGPNRTSMLVCRRSNLRVGERVTVGPIYVTGGARGMQGQWRVKTPGGFGEPTGKIELVQLQGETRRP